MTIRDRYTRFGPGAVVALLAVLGLAMAGCTTMGAPPPGGPSDPAVGHYVTVSANGTPVPGSIVNNQGVELEFLEGSMVIRSDGTCTSRSVFVVPSGEEMVREVDAIWTRDGDTVIMRWKGAGTTTVTVEGDTLTMDNAGMILVYRRAPR